MNWVGNTKKYYVDQQLPNYQQLANAAQVQFPHLRFGIGPAILNDSYIGDDKQQIEDFLTNFTSPLQNDPGEPSDLRKPNQDEIAASSFQPGDMVLVSMQGIGDVEARFVRALPGNQVLIDLDGIEESIEANIVTRFDPKPSSKFTEVKAPPPAPQTPPPEQAAAPTDLPTTDAASPELAQSPESSQT